MPLKGDLGSREKELECLEKPVSKCPYTIVVDGIHLSDRLTPKRVSFSQLN